MSISKSAKWLTVIMGSEIIMKGEAIWGKRVLRFSRSLRVALGHYNYFYTVIVQ